MNRKRILLGVAALGTAISALAQVHSNAPTNKDYRLAIVSPSDGASITGTDLTVVLAQPSVPTGQSVSEKERKDVMTPTFQIWVDGKDYGNLPTGQNVFTAHDMSYGQHKIIVAAKNSAGELVDRKEIGVTSVAASSVTSHQTDQVQPAVAVPAPVEPAAVSQPVQAQAEPSAPARAARASAPPSIPKTATSYPAAAAAGLGLVLAGFALSRRRS